MKDKLVKSRQGISLTLTNSHMISDQPQLRNDGTIQTRPIINLTDIEHDRQMIEKDFADDHLLTEAEMTAQFGKYGWGK
jgi:hypothetical protein